MRLGRYLIVSEWPEKVLSQRDGDHIVLGRLDAGDRVAGVITGKSGPFVLTIGAANAPIIKGKRVLAIDVFQTGASIAPRNRSHQHFLTFNLSDDACRVQDILTALAYLQSQQKEPIELVASGDAAVWANFAAAIAPVPVNLQADISSFHGSDEDYLRFFNVPNIERAGGIKK